MDIKEIIEKGESEKLEFKKSTTQLDKSLKSICGFLNHEGGRVYFGIDKKGKVVGQEVSDKTLKSISQKIRQRIKPEVTPEVRVLETEGKKVIEVKVKEGNNKPYYLDGIAYKRVYSDEYLNRLDLNIRQKKAIKYVKEKGSISNREYCNLLKVSRKTATNDLTDLVEKNIFSPSGTGKRILRYELRLRKNYAKR